jgi:hypothetical protein
MTGPVPDPRYWQPRRMSVPAVLDLINSLDPVDHAAEITHLSMEVLLPTAWAHLGYVTAACRTCAVPRVARRIVREGTGKQVRRPVQRDADTLTYFSELIRHGHRSQKGKALARHIQNIHSAVGDIRADDQLYTLANLIFGPHRLAAAVGARQPTATEDAARWNFWITIAEAMRLPDIPSDAADLRVWADEYERTNFEHHPICHDAAEAHVHGLSQRFPGPALGLARHIVITALDDHTAACLGYRPAAHATRALLLRATAATTITDQLRRVRLDNTWTRAFTSTATVSRDIISCGSEK